MRAVFHNGMISCAQSPLECAAAAPLFTAQQRSKLLGDDFCVARGRYYLFTTRRAGFRNSNWALTFSICAAWSFTVAARRATVLSNSAILFCCFWNSLSARLGLGALGTACSQLLPTGIDKDRA